MARPKNVLVVMPNNTVVSVAPARLKAYLTELASVGTATLTEYSDLGTVGLTLAAVTPANAGAVLQSMFGATVASTGTGTATVTSSGVSGVSATSVEATATP